MVVVDADGAGGDYALTVTLGTALSGRGDSCADPYRTALSGNTIGNQQTGDSLTGLSNDAISDTCDGAGIDRVYRLNLTVPRKVTMTLTATGSPAWRPVLYVQEGTCSATGDLECNAATAAGGTASLTFPSLGPGTYYIWLDAYGSGGGSYTFFYDLAAP